MRRAVIFKRWITVVALRDARGRFPAKDWFESLELRDRKRAEAGLRNFDTTEEAGIRMTGRTTVVRGRRHTMLELRLTRGGSTGPQLRMLGRMRGTTFYAAHGFAKTTRRISGSEIASAEAVLDIDSPDEKKGDA